MLGLLAISMALSYAMMRSQGTAILIQNNSSRQASARSAARAGLSTALARMHRAAEWGGANSTFARTLADNEGFTVTYTPGDAALTELDPDWEMYPYRVTISVEGYASDPAFPTSIAIHRIGAVVQLVPRALAPEPADWETFQQYTVFQSENRDFVMQLPSRIQGPARVQGTLKIAEAAPNANSARDQYLEDLRRMELNDGQGPVRTFTGPVYLNRSGNGTGVTRLGQLGAAAIDTPNALPNSDWQQPSNPATYQLYLGGPTYAIATLGPNLENVALGPDQETNPAGVFYRDGTLTINNNVTVQGTLLCKNNLVIQGGNVQLAPVNLPPLAETSDLVRLPTVVCSDFTVEPGHQPTVSGFVAAFNRFTIEQGSQTDSFSLTGRMVVRREFRVHARDQWTSTPWGSQYWTWNNTILLKLLHPRFPNYMATLGRNPTPVMTFIPDPDPAPRYHWFDPAVATHVIEPAPGDEGLYWDLVRVVDNP